MNRFLLIAYCLLLIVSCRFRSKKENNSNDVNLATKIDMMETDRDFSLLSEKKGLRKAYSEFIDSNGVLLRPGYKPMEGANALDYIIQSNDSSFVMTWDPKDATLSSSGDLGYTYGVYSLKQKDADTVTYGSYVTIWKRQPDGKWKFVLQSGNEGIEADSEPAKTDAEAPTSKF
jgi:ketosteroid isomerase-like protein